MQEIKIGRGCCHITQELENCYPSPKIPTLNLTLACSNSKGNPNPNLKSNPNPNDNLKMEKSSLLVSWKMSAYFLLSYFLDGHYVT